MKMISEHLGRIIATLAAIAVVIGVITCYRADLGEFFLNVISGEQRIADGVLGNMGDFDLNGDYQGPDLTIDQALGSSSDNPLGVESSSFTLSGTVTDKSGITSLTVNGNNVTVADDGTWSTTLTLTQNVATEVTVVATDSEGNDTKKMGYVGYISYISVSVGKSAYAEEIGYSDSVTDLVIPETVQKNGKWYKVVGLANNAFENCTNLTSITIPNSITRIGDSAFYGCTSLTNVTIPDSVTYIGSKTFYKCTNLTNVTIGSGVKTISSDCFDYCNNITDVYYTGTLDQWVGIYFVNNYSNPCGAGADLYMKGTLVTDITIPNSVISIGDYVFQGCTSLNRVVIPNTVTQTGRMSFFKCTGLTSVVIPDSVTSIMGSTFEGCTSLTSITFDGTMAQWNAITYGTTWNRYVPATEIVCADGTVILN